jgi:hypothetical protein
MLYWRRHRMHQLSVHHNVYLGREAMRLTLEYLNDRQGSPRNE